MRLRYRLSVFAFLIVSARLVGAQTLSVGASGLYGGNEVVSGTQTTLQLVAPVDLPGKATAATFGWSTSPCLGATKIKFFRPTVPSPALVPVTFAFLAERGPFDVTAPLLTPNPQLSIFPPVTQTVALIPPVELLPGDVIAITNVTSCGGPTYIGDLPGGIPPAPPSSLTLPGDVSATFMAALPLPLGRAIWVTATDPSSVLSLLGNRFRVGMTAIDPRTQKAAIGVPQSLGTSAGYFSLPDFTGDPTFPEVTVKMVDATSSAALGGDFWFFHAPLTDVSYTLTVRDSLTGIVRTYSNSSGSPGQLCGGVDTSAFPGP